MGHACCEAGHSRVGEPGQRLLLTLGNPNTGKTTLINALSGANLRIGNWPGTTVERVATSFDYCGQSITLVDLPGAYSLAATTPEEVVTRCELLESQPQVVINVLDAGNLERNLYLTLELTEMGLPGLLALNLIDEAASKGISVDPGVLASSTGMPVIRTVASRGQGTADLLDHLARATVPRLLVSYPSAVEEAVAELIPLIDHRAARWMALAALAGEELQLPEAAQRLAEQWVKKLEQAGLDPFLAIAEARCTTARRLACSAVQRSASKKTLTDRLDAVVLHPLLGLPVFLVGMFLTFRFTFLFSDPWVTFFGLVQQVLGCWVKGLGLPHLVGSFVADGLIGGVGTVVSFAPVLFFLYLALSFLESSGVLARAAFLVDRLMRAAGLPGRGFIPLMLGFGCNVPAIYATRTLEGFSERLRVALAIPFMACSARLAVFTLFAAVFFPAHAALVVFGLYIMGLVIGLVTALWLSRLVPEGHTSGVMELPPYRMPTTRSVFRQARIRTMGFIRGAGGSIMGAVLVVWFLLNIPPGDLAHSLYGGLSSWLGCIFRPLGFGDWRLVGALIPGFIAKEVVVGTLGVSYLGAHPVAAQGVLAGLKTVAAGLGAALSSTLNAIPALVGLPSLVPPPPDAPSGLQAAMAGTVSRAGALSYLTFVLLYTPCVATVIAIRNEFGKRWARFSVVYQLAVAYLGALAVYQIARLWL